MCNSKKVYINDIKEILNLYMILYLRLAFLWKTSPFVDYASFNYLQSHAFL